MKTWHTGSVEETEKLGKAIGAKLPPGSIVCLFGELAAGKTSFTKGLAAAATGCSPSDVTSPTYIYLNIHESATKGATTLYHFDLYRLRGPEHFLEMGFEEYLYEDAICCIEWSERIEQILPAGALRLYFEHTGQSSRSITLCGQLPERQLSPKRPINQAAPQKSSSRSRPHRPLQRG